MQGKLCLITGVTGSIGGAVAQELARTGATLVLAARDSVRLEQVRARISGATASPEVQTLQLDLASQAAVRRAAEEFKQRFSRLDLLIHVAAIYTAERRLSPDGLELMFATNHLGPFLLTQLLLEPLQAAAPSHVIVVTAPATNQLDFSNLQGERRFNSLNAFGASKVCNLLFAFAAAQRFASSGIRVNAVHPGLIQSDLMREAPWPIRWMSRHLTAPSARAGAAIAHLASARELATLNGAFVKDGKTLRAPAYAYDPEVQRRLWESSLALSGLVEQSTLHG